MIRKQDEKKEELVLKAFRQHGFIDVEETGNQIRGHCPFCLKENHFYLNPSKGVWDCKSCGAEGGFGKYLAAVNSFTQEHYTQKHKSILSKDRGILKSTLDIFDLGFNPITSKYIIPVYDYQEEKTLNLKMFSTTEGGILGTATCAHYLFNSWSVTDTHKTVWLCEGEWDCMAMYEILKKLNLTQIDVAVGSPGANIFKDDWLAYFKNKKVICVYDKDKAGFQGQKKVFVKLTGYVDELKFIHWPKAKKKNYDLRDLYLDCGKDPLKTLKHLKSFFNLYPFGADINKLTKSVGDRTNDDSPPAYTGDYVAVDEIYKAYLKWLHLESVDVLDILFGTIIANRLEGDPVWMFLIAPSGATKSELLMAKSEALNIFTTTTLTAPSLVSGINLGAQNDPSLIPRLNNKVLIVKDFTTILAMQPNHRDEIFGILRDAYDQKFEKVFGNGVTRKYNSKFGLLAGATPAIELYLNGYTAVGERFLRWREVLPEDTSDYIMKAIQNTNNEIQMRKELREIGTAVLNYDFVKQIPDLPMDIAEKVVALSQWTAMMRGTVERDKYTREITHQPFQELGTRLAKQFVKLMSGVGMLHNRKQISLYEYNLIKKVSQDTIPTQLLQIVKYVYDNLMHKKTFELKEFEDILRLPKQTTQRALENLVILRILDKFKVDLTNIKYTLTKRCRLLMEDSDI